MAQQSKFNPVTFGIVGACAAVGYAATVALKDKQTRKKLVDTFTGMRKQLVTRFQDKTMVNEMKK